MLDSYAYFGDDVVGEYVHRRLEPLGCKRVEQSEQAAVIFTHCNHLSAIEDLYFETEGLIKTAPAQAILVDLSASTPAQAREFSAVATVNDKRFVEAPLAVVDPFAPDALQDVSNVICYLAGEQADCEEVLPLMQGLAGTVNCTGPSGSGQMAKTMHTITQAASLVAAVEANALHSALHASGMAEGNCDIAGMPFNPYFCEIAAGIAHKDFAGECTCAMLMSDVAAAMAAADDAELILPQLEATLHILELFGVIGGADMGLSGLWLLYRDEKESAEAGLDWTRAEGMYEQAYADAPGEYEEDDYDFSDGFRDYYSN